MKNMKAIFTETVLLVGAIGFWAVALPAAVVVYPAIALLEKIGDVRVEGTAGAGCTMRPSAVTA